MHVVGVGIENLWIGSRVVACSVVVVGHEGVAVAAYNTVTCIRSAAYCMVSGVRSSGGNIVGVRGSCGAIVKVSIVVVVSSLVDGLVVEVVVVDVSPVVLAGSALSDTSKASSDRRAAQYTSRASAAALFSQSSRLMLTKRG